MSRNIHIKLGLLFLIEFIFKFRRPIEAHASPLRTSKTRIQPHPQASGAANEEETPRLPPAICMIPPLAAGRSMRADVTSSHGTGREWKITTPL